MSVDKRRDPRVPTELALKLAFDSVGDFIERYALNISRGGIFVRSRDPRPAGTRLNFDLRLRSGERVIRGTGVVVWTTPPSAPGEPPRAPGMGIQFVELDAASRALVDQIVARRGPAADVDEPPRPRSAVAPPPPRGDAAATSEPAASPAPRAPRARSNRIVGIDLGTTNSCVAVAEDGKARVLASRQGYTTIPSIVAYDAQGRLLVGHPAKKQMIINPRNTVYGSKRLVGRPFASPTVQACRDRFHYEIVEGDDGLAAVRFAGRTFSLQQVAAFVLAELKDVASQALGEEVTRAVVTVPAYYDDHQRQAVRQAGALAGLSVERIVNEPTAAALAFGYGRGLEERVLVYDLGGGTFDASVLEILGDVYEVLSTGGDTFLGGVDFDAQVEDHLAYAFAKQHGFPPPNDRVVWQRLRDAAEETKVVLSERASARAHVPFLCKSAEGLRDLDLDVTVTRGELEALTRRLVDRTVDVCRDVLAAKGIGPDDIAEVLLVGGQSRMPLVAQRLREALGKEPSKAVHPDEAVALGAALLADSEARIDAVVLIDVLARGIGVGLPGGRMVPVLPRNTRLPAKKSYLLSTVRDGQAEMELAIFQGDAPRVTECEYLGTLRMAGLPAAPKGSVKISVEFELGNEGILTVSARNAETGEKSEARLATLDTPASLRTKLQLAEPPTAPAGARPHEDAPAAPEPPPMADGAVAAGDRPRERRGLFGRLFGR
jgi:molecular chaperone DnaK